MLLDAACESVPRPQLLAARFFLNVKVLHGLGVEKRLVGVLVLMLLILLSRYHESGEQVEGEPLDAGSCIVVQEVQRGKVSLPFSFSFSKGDWAEVVKTLLGKPTEKLWGRVEDPTGWLLLAKDRGGGGSCASHRSGSQNYPYSPSQRRARLTRKVQQLQGKQVCCERSTTCCAKCIVSFASSGV